METYTLKIQAFETICRSKRLPLTVQRKSVLRVLADREDHPTADQVFEAVEKKLPEISRATVYRTLETLVELGIAKKVGHPGAVARFDSNIQRHHHLFCRYCRKILDLDNTEYSTLDLQPLNKKGF